MCPEFEIADIGDGAQEAPAHRCERKRIFSTRKSPAPFHYIAAITLGDIALDGDSVGPHNAGEIDVGRRVIVVVAAESSTWI